MVVKANWLDTQNVDATDLNALAAAVNAAYVKPGSGIPPSDILSTPSYTIGTRLNHYSASTNFYNLKSSNTHRLRAGIGKAHAGDGLSHQIFIGDSETTYYLGPAEGAAHLHMWPLIMRAQLANMGVNIGGTGAVPIANAGSGAIYLDPRWTLTGTWTNSTTYLQASAIGVTATFTSDVAGTVVDLSYLNTSAAFTVKIDAGSAVTVTPTGASTIGHYTVTGLSNATHTVLVTTTTSSLTYLLGCSVNQTSGLIFDNLALLGAYASIPGGGDGWSNTAGGITKLYQSRIGQLPAGVTPDCVWIALGVNDIDNGVSDAAISTALTTIRNQFPNSDCILIAQYQTSAISSSAWGVFVSILYDLADTLDVPLLDLYDRSGGYTTANANGLMASDGIHPLGGAQRDWGIAAARAFS